MATENGDFDYPRASAGGLNDVSSYPNLIQGLRERGYSDADLRKLFGENLLRVWTDVEEYARNSEFQLTAFSRCGIAGTEARPGTGAARAWPVSLYSRGLDVDLAHCNKQ